MLKNKSALITGANRGIGFSILKKKHRDPPGYGGPSLFSLVLHVEKLAFPSSDSLAPLATLWEKCKQCKCEGNVGVCLLWNEYGRVCDSGLDQGVPADFGASAFWLQGVSTGALRVSTARGLRW